MDWSNSSANIYSLGLCSLALTKLTINMYLPYEQIKSLICFLVAIKYGSLWCIMIGGLGTSKLGS